MTPQQKNPKLNRRQIKKSTWLPLLILIYFIVMAAIYGPQMIEDGDILKFCLISIAELAMIWLLHIFLKKKSERGGK